MDTRAVAVESEDEEPKPVNEHRTVAWRARMCRVSANSINH